MYVITGATGNIGKMIAEKLLAKGEKVRVVGRDKTKLQSLVDKGAEPFQADLLDTEAITKAFNGAKALYILIPPNYTAADFRAYQNEVGQSLAAAIKNAGVKHVVNLSSVGAHMAEKVGVVKGLHDQEERLNKLEGTNVLHLRPTFFMENNLWQIPTIKENGIMGSATNPDKPVPQIAISDIADYATNRLTKLDFAGKSTRELLGPKDISMNEVTKAFGVAIGKTDLKFVQFSYEDTKNAMMKMGMSEDVANNMIELQKAFNDGEWQPTETRSAENTTPTTIEEFAGTFAAAFNAG
ncbi:MAG: SDR family NAD(P)-dependent oxidoreductase [candidate division Zixibacteria bacterium]|nr:SDR family NAD(P)-dependent oxidoreductase [candidate division Zixibacteria bacterium]